MSDDVEIPTAEYAAARKAWPDPLDLSALAKVEPEPPPMVIEDWLPAGYATLLAGHGGAGKSAIALHLAVCIASGEPFFGLEVGQRRCLYLSCEDREGVLHWRLSRITDYRGTSIADLQGRLDVLDLVGHETTMYQRNPMTGIDLTAAYSSLAERMRELHTEVVFVDGVSDAFSGNENDRAQVKAFVNSLLALIPPDTGAVVLIAHVNKTSAMNGKTSEGYSGSTAWHNACRARWYLYPETDSGEEGEEATGDLLLEVQKSNLGRTNQALRFRWNDDHHLFLGEIEGGMSEFDRRARDTDERDGIIAALRSVMEAGDYCPASAQGSRTAYRVLAACTEFPESLQKGAGRKRFWRHIEALRRNRVITEGKYRRANRHIVATLELCDEQERGCATASHFPETNTAHSDADAPASDASHSDRGVWGERAHTADDYRRASEGEI